MAEENPNVHLALVEVLADLKKVVVENFLHDVWLDLLQLSDHLFACLFF